MDYFFTKIFKQKVFMKNLESKNKIIEEFKKSKVAKDISKAFQMRC